MFIVLVLTYSISMLLILKLYSRIRYLPCTCNNSLLSFDGYFMGRIAHFFLQVTDWEVYEHMFD